MKEKFLKVLSKFGAYFKDYDITIYENEVELANEGYLVVKISVDSEGSAIATFGKYQEFNFKQLNLISLIMSEFENKGE